MKSHAGLDESLFNEIIEEHSGYITTCPHCKKLLPNDTEIWALAEKRDWDSVKQLLKNGVDVNACDPLGDTCLHFAAAYNDVEAIKFLVENGANINKKDGYGWTPLVVAEQKGCLESALLLGGLMNK